MKIFALNSSTMKRRGIKRDVVADELKSFQKESPVQEKPKKSTINLADAAALKRALDDAAILVIFELKLLLSYCHACEIW